MKIEHVAVWTKDLEGMRKFYETYFGCQSNDMYHNETKGFKSYFLTFESGSRLEIMEKIGVDKPALENQLGWAHISISLGSKELVDELTTRLSKDGYPTVSGPRTTGDGYYESVIEDPEGNLIELTV